MTWTANELYEVCIANGGLLGSKLMLVHLHEYFAEDIVTLHLNSEAREAVEYCL